MGKILIDKEDISLINDSFKENTRGQILGKKASGQLINASTQIVNSRGYVINGFSGRVLKHNKSVVPVRGAQFTVGVKGQKYDDIAPELRAQVSWSESDFI